MASKLKIRVNGLLHTVTASLDTPLLYVLHNELHLHGPRFAGVGSKDEVVDEASVAIARGRERNDERLLAPKTASESRKESSAMKMWVVSVRCPSACTRKWMCAGRIGLLPVDGRSRPTGSAVGIGYAAGRTVPRVLEREPDNSARAAPRSTSSVST